MRSVITLFTGLLAGLIGCASPRSTLSFTVAEPARGAAVATAITRRLTEYGIAGADVRVEGDLLSVVLPARRATELESLRALLRRPGKLRISSVEVVRPATAVRLAGGALELTLDPEAARALGVITERSLGTALPVEVDGEVIVSPTLKAPVADGKLAITLREDQGRDRLRTLAALFASGPLPTALSPSRN